MSDEQGGPDFDLSLGIECGCPLAPGTPKGADWRKHSPECRGRQRVAGDAAGATSRAQWRMLGLMSEWLLRGQRSAQRCSELNRELPDAGDAWLAALQAEALAWDALLPSPGRRA